MTGREISGERAADEARTRALRRRPESAPPRESAGAATDRALYADAATAFYGRAEHAYEEGDHGAGDYYVAAGDGFRRLALWSYAVGGEIPSSGPSPSGATVERDLPLSGLPDEMREISESLGRENLPPRPPGMPQELSEASDICLQYARGAAEFTSRAAQALAAGNVALAWMNLQQAQAHWNLYQACVAATQATGSP
ncbi:hypothetical protein [Streptomyces sp. NPDC002067]